MMLLSFLACVDEKPEAPERCGPEQAGYGLTEEGVARGLSIPPDEPENSETGVGAMVAEDLDDDGDIDLFYPAPDGRPVAYENDGTGHFRLHTPLQDFSYSHPIMQFGVLDLDGDALPEFLIIGGTSVTALHNRGGFVWEQQFFHYDDPDPRRNLLTVAMADLDGDGDVDLVGPDGGQAPDAPTIPPMLLQNTGEAWTRWPDLGTESLKVQAPLATDRDNDGDLDLLLVNDFSTHTTFWRNDGLQNGVPVWTEDGASMGISLSMSGMGMDGYDLNRDGILDWCFSDTGPIRCFVSAGGGWYDAQAGTAPKTPVGIFGTVGWSVVLTDLDNDGLPEMAQASGQNTTYGDQVPEGPIYPDLLYRGLTDGTFENIEADFGDTWDHVSLVAADFDGDGAEELVLGSPWLRPRLYHRGCTQQNWMDVDMIGVGLNPFSNGARVEVTAGGRTQIREIHGLLSHSQPPHRLHFGLGTATEARVRVRWPDGATAEVEGGEARRIWKVEHP